MGSSSVEPQSATTWPFARSGDILRVGAPEGWFAEATCVRAALVSPGGLCGTARVESGENGGNSGGFVIVRFGRFTLEVASRQLTRDGAPVHLTPKAFDLLVLLSSEAPKVVSKATLHERLWPGTFVTDATLVGLVKEVRRALEDHDRDAPLIRTAHRIGYAFCPPRQPNNVERPGAPRHWLVLDDRRVVLGQGENLIGRDPGAQVWLDAPGVSRRHARIVIDAAGVRVEDLGSKNGTTVSEVPVRGSIGLDDGDRVGFGPVRAVYRAPAGATTTLSRAGARPENDG